MNKRINKRKYFGGRSSEYNYFNSINNAMIDRYSDDKSPFENEEMYYGNIYDPKQNINNHLNNLTNSHNELNTRIENLRNSSILDKKHQEDLLNAVKLYNQVGDLLGNPLIDDLTNNAFEELGKIAQYAASGTIKAISGAASSIPFIGEIFVAERMVKDAMQTVSNIEKSINYMSGEVENVTHIMSEAEKIQKKKEQERFLNQNQNGGKRIQESINNFLQSSKLLLG
jgi:hypothetical protein